MTPWPHESICAPRGVECQWRLCCQACGSRRVCCSTSSPTMTHSNGGVGGPQIDAHRRAMGCWASGNACMGPRRFSAPHACFEGAYPVGSTGHHTGVGECHGTTWLLGHSTFKNNSHCTSYCISMHGISRCLCRCTTACFIPCVLSENPLQQVPPNTFDHLGQMSRYQRSVKCTLTSVID